MSKRFNLAQLITVASALSVLCLNAQEPAAAPKPPAAPAPESVGPKMKFATPEYDFGKVQSGELVKYTYIFTNIGDQTLELKSVQPQCGCTAANDWTKRVEPGQTGTIAIQFNSANYNGGVVKQVTVTCNDKTMPQAILRLKGTLWKPIDVNPLYAVLNVSADSQSVTSSVRVFNNMEDPITLSDAQSNNRMFGVNIRPGNTPGKEFFLDIYTMPPLTTGATISGQITVKTSSTNMPTITVSAIGMITPPLAVIPPQLNLPQAPLANWLTNSFSIQNNSTNALQLSDASVNVKGVGVEIKETQMGKQFAALVAFPPGFEVQPGQSVAVTLKSSNPRYPLIKVPVTQPPRAAAPQPPTALPVPVKLPTPPSPGH